MSTVSTTINEVIVTGRAERQLIDKAAKLWQRISRWTHATDVEFDDGKTAQEKLGSINGITTNLVDDRPDIAASIKAVNQLNNKLANGRIELVVIDDNKLGYKIDGADTVYPFNNYGAVLYNHDIVTENIPLNDLTGNGYITSVSTSEEKIRYGALLNFGTDPIPLFDESKDGKRRILYSISVFSRERKFATGHGGGSNYYNGIFKMVDENGESQINSNVTSVGESWVDKTYEFKLFDYSIGNTNTLILKGENIQSGGKGAGSDRSPCGYSATFKDYVTLTYYQEK